jgi:hypothetical protein
MHACNYLSIFLLFTIYIMRASDIFLTIVILLIFTIIYASNILAVGAGSIKRDWPKHRCNPAIMPFASYFGHDAVENMTYCVQNMQTDYMGHLLEPVNYAMGVNQELASGLGDSVQHTRGFISDFRDSVTSIVSSIFGVFLNAMLQFQKTIIKLKDIMGKVVGISTTFLFMTDGAIRTGNSVWKGPIGGTLRTVCFHPDTELDLVNGEKKAIKDMTIDDVLASGSRVDGVVVLTNLYQEPFYRVRSHKMERDVLVTGGHYIMDEEKNKFVFVRDSNVATKTDDISKKLYCLITDDHLIKIGEHTFWDYEDS